MGPKPTPTKLTTKRPIFLQLTTRAITKLVNEPTNEEWATREDNQWADIGNSMAFGRSTVAKSGMVKTFNERSTAAGSHSTSLDTENNCVNGLAGHLLEPRQRLLRDYTRPSSMAKEKVGTEGGFSESRYRRMDSNAE